MDNLVLPTAPVINETPEEKMAREEVFGKPKPVQARFYIGAEKTSESTPDCPVYKNIIMVYMRIPGDAGYDAHSMPVRDDEYPKKFPQEWAWFEKNKDRHPIPLESLPKMTPATKAALEELQCRNLDDVIEKTLPEYLQPYKKWAQWIKAVHDNADGKKARVSL